MEDIEAKQLIAAQRKANLKIDSGIWIGGYDRQTKQSDSYQSGWI